MIEKVDEDSKEKWLSNHLELQLFFLSTKEITTIFKEFPVLKPHEGLELVIYLNYISSMY